MPPIRVLCLSLAVAICFSSLAFAETQLKVDRENDEYTLVVLPDTQRYALYFPEIFLAQTRWIKENKDKLNMKFVVHVGDVVDERTDQEWFVADRAFAELDNAVPYLVVPGNHDLEKDASGRLIRNTTKYNAVFSPQRFKGKAWYGGHKGVTNDNSFAYFTGAGQQFMVLGLEYGPSDETLDWAKTLISNHGDNHQIILVTHAYMYDDDTRLGPGDRWSPKKSDPSWNDGEDIWKKLVSQRDNICMVLSGHVKGDGTGLLISRTEDDVPVIQMLANYQFLEHGGQGWLRILHFQPAKGVLGVHTYSPWFDKYRTESDQRFDLDISHLYKSVQHSQ